MTYYDYYLKVANKNALNGVLVAAGLAVNGPDGLVLNAGVTLDEFEEYEQTGVDGQGIPVMSKKAGYFANLRTTTPITASLPMIQPAGTPYRVWLGGMNYAT